MARAYVVDGSGKRWPKCPHDHGQPFKHVAAGVGYCIIHGRIDIDEYRAAVCETCKGIGGDRESWMHDVDGGAALDPLTRTQVHRFAAAPAHEKEG